MDIKREIRRIREELAYISRYMSSISPKLGKYKELEDRKEVLLKRLEKIKHHET